MATVKEPLLGVSPLQVTPYGMSVLKHRGGEEGSREIPDSCSGGGKGGLSGVGGSGCLESLLGSWLLRAQEGLVIGSVQRPSPLCITYSYHHSQSWRKNATSALSSCSFIVGPYEGPGVHNRPFLTLCFALSTLESGFSHPHWILNCELAPQRSKHENADHASLSAYSPNPGTTETRVLSNHVPWFSSSHLPTFPLLLTPLTS